MSGEKNKRKRRVERNQVQEASPSKKVKKSSSEIENNEEMSFSSCLMFQDVMKDLLEKASDEEADQEEAVSLAMFELANSPAVGFQVETNPSSPKGIVIKQDTSACGKHTGGIVWETAYLLLQFLLSTRTELGNTLEVGAGCGVVGQVLAAKNLAKRVVMTEHADVIPNLEENVKCNKSVLACGAPLHVSNLDWENYEEDSKKSDHLEPHSFDTILGTDVVFTPQLVEPLWRTLKYMSHSKTDIYLCLQERCAASHKLLLEKAPTYQFRMEDITSQVDSIPSCEWGQALECRLFHITVA